MRSPHRLSSEEKEGKGEGKSLILYLSIPVQSCLAPAQEEEGEKRALLSSFGFCVLHGDRGGPSSASLLQRRGKEKFLLFSSILPSIYFFRSRNFSWVRRNEGLKKEKGKKKGAVPRLLPSLSLKS